MCVLECELPLSKSLSKALERVSGRLSSADYLALESIVHQYEAARFGEHVLSAEEIRSMRKKIRSISGA